MEKVLNESMMRGGRCNRLIDSAGKARRGMAQGICSKSHADMHVNTSTQEPRSLDFRNLLPSQGPLSEAVNLLLDFWTRCNGLQTFTSNTKTRSHN